jgi:hypothetical protein
MKPLKWMFVLLLLLPAFTLAQKKPKKPSVPAVFAQARYAYVQATDGNEFDPRLFPEDREAIANVENALRGWGRYSLTVRREDADIVFVVRKGRLASAQETVNVNRVPGASTEPNPSPGPAQQGGQFPGQISNAGTEMGTSGEVGPPEDLLEVRLRNADGSLSNPLWMRSLEDGLNGSRPMLFMQFKEAVDKAYPPTPPNPPSQPGKP